MGARHGVLRVAFEAGLAPTIGSRRENYIVAKRRDKLPEVSGRRSLGFHPEPSEEYSSPSFGHTDDARGWERE